MRLFGWTFLFVFLAVETGSAQQPAPSPRGGASLNPDISLDGLFSAGYFSKIPNLQFGGHDPKNRGFTAENIELTLGSVVDPYFRADAHIVLLIEDGETVVEVEETYLTTLALPHHLQLLAGQFFTRFGRLNPTHPHTWDWADQPVVNSRFFGPDGVRNPGMQLSYLFPLPFYLELAGSVQNANGETAVSFLSKEGEEIAGRILPKREVHSLGDLLYLGRARASWDLSEAATLVLGSSALLGPNASGPRARTNIFGGDLYFKWRPARASFGWPFFTVQTEALWRNYQAGEFITPVSETLAATTLRDGGFYTQAAYGFTRRWVAGLRFDLARGNDPTDPQRDHRWRGALDLTFYPSEFSKWRLQYDHDVAQHRSDRPIHALFLQWEFLIGAHGAHKF